MVFKVKKKEQKPSDYEDDEVEAKQKNEGDGFYDNEDTEEVFTNPQKTQPRGSKPQIDPIQRGIDREAKQKQRVVHFAVEPKEGLAYKEGQIIGSNIWEVLAVLKEQLDRIEEKISEE